MSKAGTTTLVLTIEDVIALRVALSESDTLDQDAGADRLYARLTAAGERLGYEIPDAICPLCNHDDCAHLIPNGFSLGRPAMLPDA